MTSEATPATPAPAAEPAPAATAQVPANPEPQATPKPEPDWRAAYAGLQRTVNKLHTREADLLQQNSSLAGSVGALKEDLDVLLKQSVGEDEFGKRVANRAIAEERGAALQAVQAGQSFIVAQTGLFLDTLKAVGVDPADPTIDWARDAGSVEEWRERVGPSIVARIQRATEERIRAHEAANSAKSKKEIEAEALAIAEETVKAAGIDKIDPAKGSSRRTFAEKVRDADYRNSPQFLKDLSDAKAGRLKT